MRERDSIIKERCTFVQRMQKAMVKMNLLLHNVVDDITEKTGMLVITGILNGERDPKRLAALRNPHSKKSEVEITEAFIGYYKEDQFYLLKINFQSFCFFDKQLCDLDRQITKPVKHFPRKKTKKEERPDNGKSKLKGKNDIRTTEDIEDVLFHVLGAFYRRLAPRIGKAQAIIATCRKLAILFYNTLSYGKAYMEQGELIYKQNSRIWKGKNC